MINYDSYINERQIVQFHDKLNPHLWQGYSLKPMVREHLLADAMEFINFCEIPRYALTDVEFTGSNAGYAYNNKSDIDIHLIVIFELLSALHSHTTEQLNEMFLEKKRQWMLTHTDDKLFKYQIEVYVSNTNDLRPMNQGRYSIMTNNWLAVPHTIEVNPINDPIFKQKIKEWKYSFDTSILNNSVEDLKIMKDKLRTLRGKSLQSTYGEYDKGNLLYKYLRNNGYFEKVNNRIKELENGQGS